jgi:riboflavin kinase/FMN adenylyltransferase
MKYTALVVKGKGRGKLLGFPTFNLEVPRGFDEPFGIYAAWVWIGEEQYSGALHYGPIPTFQEAEPSLEIFVLDYEEEGVVEELVFEVEKYIREIQNFPSQEALHDQIALDVHEVRKLTQ